MSTVILYSLLVSHTSAACPSQFRLRDLIILIISGKECKLCNFSLCDLFHHLVSSPPYVQTLSSPFCSQGGRDRVAAIATSYGLDGPRIEPDEDETFGTSPDRPQGPPSLLYNCLRGYFTGMDEEKVGIGSWWGNRREGTTGET